MWTLILYTSLVGLGPNGGVHSASSTLKFDTQPQCYAAAKNLNQTESIFDLNKKEVGVIIVHGVCVEAAK